MFAIDLGCSVSVEQISVPISYSFVINISSVMYSLWGDLVPNNVPHCESNQFLVICYSQQMYIELQNTGANFFLHG